MGSEWEAKTLGEVLDLKRGYDLPQSKRQVGAIPVVSSAGISAFHSEPMVKGPGVVTGRYGTIGQVFYIAGDYWPLNTTLYVRDFKGNDPKFVHYLLKTIDYRSYSDKAAVPGVNRNHLHMARVVIPSSLSEQKAIAAQLSSIDDKIELNRQMNATLEAMAQALFKSWFVDFDPVIDNALAAGNPIPDELQARANARQAISDKGKPLPKDVRKQFPDRFVLTEEMGWVPEGWEVKTVEEIANAIGMGPFGSNIKVETFVDSGVPIVNGQHLNETLLESGRHNFISPEHAASLSRSLVQCGDLVFTHRGNIGQVSLVPEGSDYTQYVVSQSQLYLRPDYRQVASSYLIYYFRSAVGQHRLLSNASQVGVPSIARPSTHLKALKLLLPKYELIRAFDGACQLWFSAIVLRRAQTNRLEQLRDLILPKLLVGELKIPDAHRAVEAIS